MNEYFAKRLRCKCEEHARKMHLIPELAPIQRFNNNRHVRASKATPANHAPQFISSLHHQQQAANCQHMPTIASRSARRAEQFESED